MFKTFVVYQKHKFIQVNILSGSPKAALQDPLVFHQLLGATALTMIPEAMAIHRETCAKSSELWIPASNVLQVSDLTIIITIPKTH